MTTDASNVGIGAVLQQQREDQLLTFASRTLSPAERWYLASEHEALACLFVVEKWHVYLWGRHFTLQTNHQALTTSLSAGAVGRHPLRIFRWCAQLLQSFFTILQRCRYCRRGPTIKAAASASAVSGTERRDNCFGHCMHK